MYISVSSKFSKIYGLTLYFLAKSNAGCIYFNILPPHFVHFPVNGGLLNFSLQFTHLNPCCENFLKLPLISLMKCLSITNLLTSDSSTALIFLHKSIIPFNLSCIVGN